MSRRGITPVISIVLILMITVAIAGIAYVWINNIMKNKIDDTNAALETKLDILDLACASTDTVNLSIQNTGKRNIDAGTTYIYFKDISDGSVKGRLEVDWSAQDFVNPEGYSTISNLDISSIVNWVTGDYYELRFVFPTTQYEIAKTCTVK